MPAIGNVTPTLGSVLPRTGRAEQLSCRAAPKKCSSQWVPQGLGCLKGYTPAAFSTSRGPLSLSALAAVRLGLQPCCDFCAGWAKGGGKEGAGLTQVRQGRKRPRGTAGNGTARQEHPGEAQPAPHPGVCSMGREGWGETSSLCQLGSCRMGAHCRALVSTSLLKQVLGGQCPAILPSSDSCREAGTDISRP